MNTVKYSKKNYFEFIADALNGRDVDVPIDELVAFCQKEIDGIDARNTKARERAAAKREAGDELTEAVFAALTDEPATRAEIAGRINPSFEASVAKTGYRLTQLCKMGRAIKEDIIVTDEDGKSKKMSGYRLA